MKKLPQLLLCLFFFGCNSNSNSDKKESAIRSSLQFTGFYEYRAQNGNKNEYLLIDTLANKYYGIYYRTEPKRGKGQWYYANSISNLQIEKDSIRFYLGKVSSRGSAFTAPGKKIGVLPESNIVNMDQALKFYGKFSKNKLELHCTTLSGNCPGTTMRFRKIPLPE